MLISIGLRIAEAEKRLVKTAILLVDSDLGFLFWLGRTLDMAGYEAFPARSIADAETLLSKLHLTVALLVLNFSLPGAATLVATLRGACKPLRVISLVGSGEEPPNGPGVDAVCQKPAVIDENAKAEWLETVRRVLSGECAYPATGSQLQRA